MSPGSGFFCERGDLCHTVAKKEESAIYIVGKASHLQFQLGSKST